MGPRPLPISVGMVRSADGSMSANSTPAVVGSMVADSQRLSSVTSGTTLVLPYAGTVTVNGSVGWSNGFNGATGTAQVNKGGVSAVVGSGVSSSGAGTATVSGSFAVNAGDQLTLLFKYSTSWSVTIVAASTSLSVVYAPILTGGLVGAQAIPRAALF